MKILVTGATGFIGRNLLERLLIDHPASDITCLVKDSVKPAERDTLARLRGAGVAVIQGDLNDAAVSRELPPRLDVVFHLAANIDTLAPDAVHRVNDLGTAYLLAWLGEAARGTRFIYASSIAVADRDRPSDGPLNEASPCVPRTEYGRSKLRAEQIIQAQAGKQGFHYTILRLATVYGPGSKADGLFDRLFKLTAKKSLLGRLNWPGKTSIVHVDDVSAIMVELAGRPETADQIYCVANPNAPTVGALAEHIGRLSPAPYDQINLPPWMWKVGRAVVWNPGVRMLAAPIAQVLFWRLTLLLDDGFWFDTAKLQGIWSGVPVGLDEGLARMVTTIVEVSSKLAG